MQLISYSYIVISYREKNYVCYKSDCYKDYNASKLGGLGDLLQWLQGHKNEYVHILLESKLVSK